ncbi:MAG: hypothetical protein J6I37_07190 [Prevotella sp.]|nr:hypothetical protein [Prevotella sp.]
MVLGLLGFRNRGPWTPGMELRAEDRCQIGRSWVIAKEDHVASESFADDADKWYYLVDARGLDDLDVKLEHLTEQNARAEAAIEASEQATRESKAQTEAAAVALEVFERVYQNFDSDDWLYCISDAQGLLVWGIKKDGSVYQPKGIPEETRKWLESLHTLEHVEAPNWLYVIADSAGNICWGIKKDGTVYEPKGIPVEAANAIALLKEKVDGMMQMEVIESDDYAYVIADNAGHVMFGIDHQGRVMVNGMKGVVTVEKFTSMDYLYAVTDNSGNLLFGVRADGTFCVSKFELPKNIAEQISQLLGRDFLTEDTEEEEFIYKIVDQEGHIVFGVFYSGNIYMPKGMPNEVRKELDSMDAIIKQHTEQIAAIKGITKDWSDETSVRLPKPITTARVYITGAIPTSKYYTQAGMLTYIDFLGNSFTKHIIWNVQGNISAGFDKKNWSIDLLNSADEDDSFDVQFGGWVPQDSFHLKAYASDFLKIRSLGVYRHAEQIAQSRDLFKRRPWDMLLAGSKQDAAAILKGGASKHDKNNLYTLEDDMYTGAMGHPDGFPFMLYINGEPWGLYTWNIKKSKDNYYVTKNDDNGKQLFFGDYPSGLFWHRNTDHWTLVKNYLSDAEAENYEPWDATKGYNVGDQCYVEDVVNFSVGGNSSAVTIRRLFRFGTGNVTYAGYDYDEEGYPCLVYRSTNEETGEEKVTMSRILNKLTMNPSHINWSNLEVRNPKKTIAAAFTGNDEEGNPTYKLEYYDYDSPNDYAQTGVYERTHEIISESMFTQKQVTAMTGTGESKAFSKKEYTRSVNTRKTLDELSWVFPILETTLSEQNLTDWGFASQSEAKKAIFSEHWDTDHNIDFFLVLNDSYTGDSLTHNTLYTMYDGKKVFCNHYDTDFAFGMGITYGNSFPSVYSSIYAPGGTAMAYLWSYYKEEIKSRWAALRDSAVISKKSFERMVWMLVRSIGFEAYKEDLRLWSQCSFRDPVYWRMPSGGLTVIGTGDKKYHGYDESINGYNTMPAALKELYDADPANTEFDATKQYVASGGTVENMYCTVTDGDSVHWFQCTANCKGIHPVDDNAYTCGYPASGGVKDTPQRCIEWFGQRVAYMDSLLSYEPSATADIMEAIQGAIATDDDIEALFGH